MKKETERERETGAGFGHLLPIQVRFKDIDGVGHVNNACYLSYLELGRIAYFQEITGGKVDWSRKGIILARIVIDYKEPVLLNDEVYVGTCCSRIGGKSFDLSCAVIKKKNGKYFIAASALSVLVCYDYEKAASMKIPPAWKRKLAGRKK